MSAAKIGVGIHIRTEPTLLHLTLESVRAHSPSDVQPVLIVHPESCRAVRSAVDLYSRLRRLYTPAPTPASAFNALRQCEDEEFLYIVLLEEGIRVAPGWLEPLLSSLEQEPRCGAVGPSTNLATNQQAVFPRATGSQEALAAASRSVRNTAGLSLHPLSDGPEGFCYAMRRTVALEIGAAQDSETDGQTWTQDWTQDYNQRLRQHSYQTCWAQASYVYRKPSPELRMRCASVATQASLAGSSPSRYGSIQSQAGAESFSPGSQPLVSCIMPTRGRPEFIQQSLRYYRRQDYPHRELIIVYDAPEDLPPDLSASFAAADAIRLLQTEPGTSIGEKRNLACSMARGQLIAQWDDDDWYASDRLRLQIEPIVAGQADISGLHSTLFLELRSGKVWACSPEHYRHMFVENVHGGTLTFRKHVWQHVARYPQASLREDACFLEAALRKGASLARLGGREAYVYVRHGANSWDFQLGQSAGPDLWQLAAETPIPDEDWEFYRAFRAEKRHTKAVMPTQSASPLVSCIMPTRDRQEFVPAAIHNFLKQDYPTKELVVVDNGEHSIEHLIPSDPSIRYFRHEQRRSIGALRNLACGESRGQYIAHWDDDDWRATDWLSHQVALLQQSEAQICGLDQVYFFDPGQSRAWIYRYPPQARSWVCGGTLCYERQVWLRTPFQDVSQGEDTLFVWQYAPPQLLKSSYMSGYIAIIHPGNTSPKQTAGSYWTEVSAAQVEAIFNPRLQDTSALRVKCSLQLPLSIDAEFLSGG